MFPAAKTEAWPQRHTPIIQALRKVASPAAAKMISAGRSEAFWDKWPASSVTAVFEGSMLLFESKGADCR
jgi:hypothetical protein